MYIILTSYVRDSYGITLDSVCIRSLFDKIQSEKFIYG